MPYLCSMYYKILCMALAFAISLSVAAEDLGAVCAATDGLYHGCNTCVEDGLLGNLGDAVGLAVG